MSEEQLKAFLEAVKADEGLQEQLKAAADADAVVAIAKAAGFAISAEELQRAQAELSQAELSEEELEGVVAGGSVLCGWFGPPPPHPERAGVGPMGGGNIFNPF
jgi:predicted ribosomally synthesized peptide with nif11-like leader